MAPGWITLLKSVPWDVVIRNAPKVAGEAKKLWDTISKKEIQDVPLAEQSDTTDTAKKMTVAKMKSKIITLEAAVADLNNQMLASSELIKALAEQNTQLVNRVETSRIMIKWIAVISAGIWILLSASLILAVLS